MKTIKRLLEILDAAERKRATLLLLMMLAMAMLDTLGVASILPFIAVLTNPALVETNVVLIWGYEVAEAFGIESIQHYMFFLGVLVFLLLVVSLAVKAIVSYALFRFALMREHSISRRLIEGYLYQPYSWFLNRNSADLGKNILSEVSNVIYGALIPFLTLIAQTVVAVALLILLVVVDPMLAFSAGAVLGVAYGSIMILMSGWLDALGNARLKANQDRYTVVSEAFGAVKDVKVGALEPIFVDRFSKPAKVYAQGQATAIAISQVPRFVIEAIAFGGMLLIILYLMLDGKDFTSTLPIITLYAVAGYRLMPALQQIYGALSQLKFAGPALDALYDDIKSVETYKEIYQPAARFPFNQNINLNCVTYKYPGAESFALRGVTFNVPVRSTVGLVGTSGSGKSTTLDVILGLLEPESGQLSVDGETLSDANMLKWRRSIGYVPQHIYLTDDTVAANIAFGIDPTMLDQEAVERASKIANLHDFIMQNMPSGYNTVVGERGVRLSGGQRQRIGIARALYHRPSVLILDEATSALDNLTEHAVMEAVRSLRQSMTIIIVAHRLTTVRACDNIVMLENGVVTGTGTFDELVQCNDRFKAMASEIGG